MPTKYIGIDVHKSEAQVAVMDDQGEVVDQQRVPNDYLESVAKQYEGHEAALEASSNYFTIYDTLSEYLDVTLANPGKAPWLQGQRQKKDRKDAKNLARYLRLGDVPESYVPPKPMRRIRSLVRGRKKFVDKRGDFSESLPSEPSNSSIVLKRRRRISLRSMQAG